MAVTVKQFAKQFAMNHTICPFETNKAASAGGVDQIHWRRRQGPRERGAEARGRGRLPYALSPRCRPEDNAPNSAHETERLQSSDTIELKSMVSRLAVVTPVNRQDNDLQMRRSSASQEHHRSITVYTQEHHTSTQEHHKRCCHACESPGQ